MTSAAQLVHELVRAVDLLDYDDPSLTFTIDRTGWDLGGDVGPEVDDVVGWFGEDLSAALSAALVDVRARPQRATFDHGPRENYESCVDLAGTVWRTLPARGSAMLDVAYIPRSRVVGGRCWEVGVETEGLDETWLTGTLRDGLERCWSHLRSIRSTWDGARDHQDPI